MSEIPPIFDIDAFDHSLRAEEIDWTHSEEAAAFAFKYGWMRASDVKDLVEKIERLREENARLRVSINVMGRAVGHYLDKFDGINIQHDEDSTETTP